MGVVGSWVEAHGLWVVVVVKKEIVLVRVYVADTGAGTGGREPVQRAGHSRGLHPGCRPSSVVCWWRSGSDSVVAGATVFGMYTRLACLCLALGSYGCR